MTILVCGDAMVDRYWFGDVSRISPEAPIPVLKVSRAEERAGAARNVALNVRAMGVRCDTAFGSSVEPIVKIRAIGRSQQMLRLDFDSPQDPIEELPSCEAQTVIFSDYGKGSLARIERLIGQANERKMRVIVDPKGYDYERYRWSDVVKPNLDEMRACFGGWKNEEDLGRKVRELRGTYHIGAVLLTRASEGMTLYDEEGIHQISSLVHEVYDVTGAGDTAIAALAVALCKGHDLLAAARYANKAAGIAVSRFGTAVVTEAEVFG